MAQAPDAKVAALLVAQDAFRDDRGRTHVIGIFDNIAAQGFPLLANLMIFCSIRGTKHQTYQAMVRLVDSLSNIMVQTEQLPVEITELKGHNLFVGLGVRFPGPGLYKVQAFVDGIQSMEVPLMVRQAESPPRQDGSNSKKT